MGRRRRIRHSDRRGRATRVGAQPVLDFSLDNSFQNLKEDELEAFADIKKNQTSIEIGIRDDQNIGEGTNTLTWVLDEKAKFGFKKEVYIFSEKDDISGDISQSTSKSLKLVKGSPIKAVTILIEDNDGSPKPIRGTRKNDTLAGTDDADTIYGFKKNDTLSGLKGDDNLYGFSGNDTIDGGRDDDFIAGHAGRDRLLGVIGNDIIDGGVGDDTINGGHGSDRLFGWLGDDTIIGEKGNDELYGEGDDDLLDGGIGDDLLDGGTGVNDIMGGEGDDTIVVNKQGKSTVSDFEVDDDKLQLAQNLKYGSLNFKQKGQDTLIQFKDKTLVVLEGVDKGDLSGADFI